MLNHPAFGGLGSEPFVHGPSERRLTALLDTPSVRASVERDLLIGLATRPGFRCFSTAHYAFPRVRIGKEVSGRGGVSAIFDGPEGLRELSVPMYESKQKRARVVAKEDGVSYEKVLRLLCLHVLVQPVKEIDFLVIDPEHMAGFLGRNLPNARTPGEGLAKAGLALRARGDFVIEASPSGSRSLGDRGFYRAVVLGSVEGLGAWSDHAASARTARQGSHEADVLLGGLDTRLSRALRARDYLQVRMAAPELPPVWDEVLTFFELILLQLAGCFDIVARLLDLTYALRAKRPKWSTPGFADDLIRAEPALQPFIRIGGPLHDLRLLVHELRNHIHEAPLSDELHDGNSTTVWGPGVVALPTGIAEKLAGPLERHGGMWGWGVSAQVEQVLDPGLYAEAALRASVSVLDDLLTAADPTRLAARITRRAWPSAPDQVAQRNAVLLFGLREGGLLQERATSV